MYKKFSIKDKDISDFKKGSFVLRFLNFTAPFKSETEVHKKINDVYIVYSGKAKVLVSDKYAGGKFIEPEEVRGCEIIESQIVEIESGDVLLIPANTAHQLIVEEGEIIQVIAKLPEE
ncbi:MAG: hypothetical protein WBH76_05310 [Dictyoglomaceae bacterium]|nr:hypothetical protein [Dictyoglomaceae bacterium]HPU43955.1 hypothetical protein [Dictyoglomaceae bacterium]